MSNKIFLNFLLKELQRRCSTLITLIEREICDLDDRSKQRGPGALTAGLGVQAASGALPGGTANTGQKRKSTSAALGQHLDAGPVIDNNAKKKKTAIAVA